MEKHLHPAQLGFIKEGECQIHISDTIKDIEYLKKEKSSYKQAGLLFIDFKQAFDSVDHKILNEKIESFPHHNRKW